MKVFYSNEVDYKKLSQDDQLYVYNGMDCCLTREIWNTTTPMLEKSEAKSIYDFELAQQVAAMGMMESGILVDPAEKASFGFELETKLKKLQLWCDKLTRAITQNEAININSPIQMHQLFYTHMGFPIQHRYDSKQNKRIPTTNREALEKLQTFYWANPVINAILAIRDLQKQLQIVQQKLIKGAYFSSFGVASTNTGRWNSKKNVWASGSNAQNLSEKVRRLFIARPGMKLGYADLEQAESRVVAYISQDEKYIAACEGADLHTTVAKMVWKELNWYDKSKNPISTGTAIAKKHDRTCADSKFYRNKSYRDLSKIAGHGSNYYGKPFTLAKLLHVPTNLITDFQLKYFEAFNGIPKWHSSTARQLEGKGWITTPLGLKRIFFGRLNQDETLRKAIAFVPQSTVAYIIGIGAIKVLRELVDNKKFRVLAQIHDALLFEYDENFPELALKAVELMTVPVTIHNRRMIIPVDLNVGYSWKKELMAPLGSTEELTQVRPESDLLSARF